MCSLAKRLYHTIFEDVHIVASKYNMTSSSSELDSRFLLKLTKHQQALVNVWKNQQTSRRLLPALYMYTSQAIITYRRIHASIFLYIVRNNLATVDNPTICCLCYYLNLDLDINLCSNLDQYFEFRFLNTDIITIKFKIISYIIIYGILRVPTCMPL